MLRWWHWALMGLGILIVSYLIAAYQRSQGFHFARALVMSMIGLSGLILFVLGLIYG